MTQRSVYLGPGVAEAIASPEHFRWGETHVIDYGPEWDEVPRPELQPRRRWWQRFLRREI